MFVDKINGYTGVDHAVVKPVTTCSKKKKTAIIHNVEYIMYFWLLRITEHIDCTHN